MANTPSSPDHLFQNPPRKHNDPTFTKKTSPRAQQQNLGPQFCPSSEGGLILLGRSMLSKPVIQFSVDGRGCVPSLFFDLRPNYGGGNEDNGDLLQKVPCTHCCTQCPQSGRRPLPNHASSRDSWTLTGKSVSYLWVTAPGSQVLVHTGYFLCPP